MQLGRFLNGGHDVPGLVLCSAALRTRETLEALLPELDARPDVQFLSELYLADADTILSFVRHARDGVAALMVVGHNPGLEECAHRLAQVSSSGKMHKRYLAMTGKFPTCALAALDFEIRHWRDVAAGEGALKLFVRPKDLNPEI